MKISCNMIRDLLPLYVENMASEDSVQAVNEHIAECEPCRTIYEQMKEPQPQIVYDTEPLESMKKQMKKSKRRFGWKVCGITLAALGGLAVLRLILIGILFGILGLSSCSAKVDRIEDISQYEYCIGENAQDVYENKWDMDESIFPAHITDDMKVNDFKSLYYNPWDAQYFSYLVVDYSDSDYKREAERLKTCAQEEYIGIYGSTGFAPQYELLAMESDAYQGLIYAITDGENRIIYVEMIFCNYFMDLDYESEIPAEYLPVGFNARIDNPYMKEMMADNSNN